MSSYFMNEESSNMNGAIYGGLGAAAARGVANGFASGVANGVVSASRTTRNDFCRPRPMASEVFLRQLHQLVHHHILH